MHISSNENSMALIQEHELVGFWDWEITSRKKYLSNVIKNMLGYEEHELPGEPDAWLNLIIKEDQSAVINSYQKHVASKGSYPFEVRVRYRHKNGGIVHVLSKGKVTEWDYMGNPVRMVGYDTDLSGIVKEYTVMEEKYEQLNTVIDMMNAGVWSCDVFKGRQYWSDHFYNAIGYASTEIAPTYFNLLHLLTHPDDNGNLVKAIDAQVKEKKPYSLDVRLQNKEGVYNWFETSGRVSFNEEDKPAKITGFIVRRKEAQAVENAAGAILPPQKTQQPKGDFEYDLNRAKFTFSKEVLDILELPADASLKFEPVNKMFTEESQETFQEGFNKAVYAKENYEITLTCTTPKGYIKTLREKAGPVIDKTGKVTALKGTIEELESRKGNGAEMGSAAALKMAEQNKRLLNFAHIASHNLRSHAGNLHMILQVLNSSQNEEERRFCLESLEKISSSLSRSISNLNELVGVETDLNRSRVPIAFKDVFANVTDTLAQQVRDTKALIEADFTKCPIVDYIPAYLESIMLNLISNAIKYRQPQRTPHIQVRSYMESGSTILLIKDNGMGIDLTRHKDKLFRMHQTFHNHPDSKGIGLLITKNQVEAMGGTISLESEPGTGTTFIIKF